MKNILISFMLLLVACKTPQKATSQVSTSKTITTTIDNCSENGTCTLELIPNKTLEFKTDEFGNLYPFINEGSKTIFKYTFTKNPIENTTDSNYTELIYAELDSPILDINLVNEQLQNVQLHYGRLCFCKGESGYFPIKNGNFSLTNSDQDSLKIDLNFSVKKIPQIISEIHQTVSLKSNETN